MLSCTRSRATSTGRADARRGLRGDDAARRASRSRAAVALPPRGAGRRARRAAAATTARRSSSSSSAWASSAAASSTSPPTSTSSSCTRRKARPPARAARQPRVLRPARPARHRARSTTSRADGYVFRVDMRLRPYGDSGPLTVPFAALEHYLVTQGRAWERYAWLKARALTGARHDELDALVHAVRLPQVPRLRRLRGPARHPRADPRAGQAPRLRPNIKLGPGGIREIEFIVQALQLVRGGREPALRVRGTLPALAALGARGLLPAARPRALRDAYVFLRNLEHRLQYRDDQQTQTLPADAGRARGARAGDGLRRRRRVRRARSPRIAPRSRSSSARCSASRAAPRRGDSGRTPATAMRFAALWRGDVSAESAQATLAARRLRRSRRRSPRRSSASARARATCSCRRCRGSASTRWCRSCSRVAAAMPVRGADAQTVFERLLALLEAVSRRSAYLALLIEHPPLLPRLAQLMGALGVGGRLPARGIRSCSTSCSTRACCSPSRTGSAWRAELARLLADHAGDAERQMDALRHFQHAQSFRLLAQDLAGRLTVERLADHLSALADIVLAATLRRGLGADRGRRRRAAALRDHRLRQARRQGAGLRVRPRPRVPLRRRRRAGARALRAARAAPHHLAHQHHRGRPALRHRPAAAARRRRGPAGARRSRRSAATSASRRGPGSTRRSRARASSPATRRSAPRSRPSARRSCACRATRPTLGAEVVEMRRKMLRRASRTRRRCSTSSTTPAAWSTSSSPCSTWCSPMRTPSRD